MFLFRKVQNVRKTAGILRDKTKNDKLMYSPNYDKENYPFCKLKSFVEKTTIPINQDLRKVPEGF